MRIHVSVENTLFASTSAVGNYIFGGYSRQLGSEDQTLHEASFSRAFCHWFKILFPKMEEIFVREFFFSPIPCFAKKQMNQYSIIERKGGGKTFPYFLEHLLIVGNKCFLCRSLSLPKGAMVQWQNSSHAEQEPRFKLHFLNIFLSLVHGGKE